MKKQKNKYSHILGFSLIEISLSLFLLGVMGSLFIGIMIYSNRNIELLGKKERALLLAEEGIEATRNIRDQDFILLADGNHGLAITENKWQFSGSSDTTDIFTRSISISSIDSTTKEITSIVSWPSTSDAAGTVSLKTYLTNWRLISQPPIGNWSSSGGGGGGSGGSGPSVQSQENIYGVLPWGLKVKTKGNYAYVTVNIGFSNFIIIDISNLNSPNIIQSLTLPWLPMDVAIQDNNAYIATTDETKEIEKLDITNPQDLQVLSTYNAPGSSGAKIIKVNSNTGYLLQFFGDFTIVNLESMQTLGQINLGSECNDFTIVGDYAYFACNQNTQEIKILNISNPQNPILVGSYNANGNWDGLSIVGFDNRLILGRQSGGTELLDTTNPINPTLIQNINVGNDVRQMALGNNNTYVFMATANNNAEFQVAQITSNTINVIGQTDVPSNFWSGDLSSIEYRSDLDRIFVVGEDWQNEFKIIKPAP